MRLFLYATKSSKVVAQCQDLRTDMTVRLYKYYFPREQGFPPARRSQTL